MLRVGEALRGPSRTAVLTAAARALHREEPQPWVIDDHLALELAGPDGLMLLPVRRDGTVAAPARFQ
jgi:O-methyltransferase involved in polyketide biosynthesis